LRCALTSVTIRRVLTRFRRTAAIATAFGALAPLLAIRWAAGSEGSGAGGGTSGGLETEFSYGGMAESDIVAATLLAVAIALIAAGLWAVNDRRVLGAAVVALVGAAIATALVTTSAAAGEQRSGSSLRAVPIGIDRDELEDRLGAPDGSGTARRLATPYLELDCLVYRRGNNVPFLYCFEGDRLVRKLG
jgi:hypothetical protein